MIEFEVQRSGPELFGSLEAESIGNAVHEAIEKYGYDEYVLAVYPKGETIEGPWILVGWRGETLSEHPTLDEALQNQDDGDEVWIAVPKEPSPVL